MLRSASFLFAFSSNHYAVPRSDTILRYDTLRYIFKTSNKTSLIIGTKCVRFKLLNISAIPVVSPKSHKYFFGNLQFTCLFELFKMLIVKGSKPK